MPPSKSDAARWFTEVVQPHEPALRAFLHARFPSLQETDDLVQESYVRVLRAQATSGITNVKAFLFSTARNLALDLFRRGKVVRFERIEASDHSFVLDAGQNVVEGICHEQELSILQAAITNLPVRCREVLTLRKLQGLSREEIATRMGISTNTVNAQIALGMLRCRKYFQEHGLIVAPDHED